MTWAERSHRTDVMETRSKSAAVAAGYDSGRAAHRLRVPFDQMEASDFI